MDRFEEEKEIIDFEFKRKVVVRRFFEIITINFALSAFAVILNLIGLVTQRYALVIFLGIFIAVFEYINIRKMRVCFEDIKDKKIHYLLNFIAYMLFVILNGVVYKYTYASLHTWLFSLSKILTFLDIQYKWSFLFFHAVGVIAIALAPAGQTTKMIREEFEY